MEKNQCICIPFTTLNCIRQVPTPPNPRGAVQVAILQEPLGDTGASLRRPCTASPGPPVRSAPEKWGAPALSERGRLILVWVRVFCYKKSSHRHLFCRNCRVWALLSTPVRECARWRTTVGGIGPGRGGSPAASTLLGAGGPGPLPVPAGKWGGGRPRRRCCVRRCWCCCGGRHRCSGSVRARPGAWWALWKLVSQLL